MWGLKSFFNCYTLVLDVLTKHVKDLTLQCMLFADDLVLVGESREEINGKVETWREALEACGFHFSRSKTKYKESEM